MTHLCDHCKLPEDEYSDCPNYCGLKLAIEIARKEMYFDKYSLNLTRYDNDRKNLEKE